MALRSKVGSVCGLALILALGACTMPPEGTTPQQQAAYDQAVASVGCTMRTEPQYLAVELQTGMTRAQAMKMAQFRMAEGAAVPVEGGGVRLVTGPCAT